MAIKKNYIKNAGKFLILILIWVMDFWLYERKERFIELDGDIAVKQLLTKINKELSMYIYSMKEAEEEIIWS